MKPMKKWCKILIIAVAIILALAIIVPLFVKFCAALPWMLIYVGIWISPPYPAPPEITYGEFPFEIVYEVNGERFEVEDILVCEYTGIGADEGRGKYRTWKSYLKSDGSTVIVMERTDELLVYCTIGSAAYYMGDLGEDFPEDYVPSPSIRTFGQSEYVDGMTEEKFLTWEQAYNEYGIEIISWNFAEPIDNTFSW